jgi:hypothetical protein
MGMRRGEGKELSSGREKSIMGKTVRRRRKRKMMRMGKTTTKDDNKKAEINKQKESNKWNPPRNKNHNESVSKPTCNPGILSPRV